jgi:hypothetical protein
MTKGKYSSEPTQEKVKRALSETPEEKTMRREERKDKKEKKQKEKDKTRKSFDSTALSSADEHVTVSSSVLSALKCADGYAEDDKSQRQLPK